MDSATSDAKVVSVPAAGRILGLSRETAYKLARRGVIPTLRLGHSLKVPRAALDRMLDSAGTGGQSERTVGKP